MRKSSRAAFLLVPALAVGAAIAPRAAMLATPPGPVTLRYAYKPGQALLYAFTDSSSSATKTGDRPEVTEYRQTSSGTVRKAVVSSTGGQGVIDETPMKASSERTDARGTTTQLLPAVTRRYTFTTAGKVLRTERIAPGAKPDASTRPFDGFAFSLPEKPVSPGASWTEALRVIGLDGNPINVKATSTYRGPKTRSGHPADQIDVVFSSAFTATGTGVAAPIEGSLKGAATYYLARDLGQEVESSTQLTIVLKGTGTVDGVKQPVTRTLHFVQTRTLTK